MKKHLLTYLVFILPVISISQNVGINTITPLEQLQVGDLLGTPGSNYIMIGSPGNNTSVSGIKLRHFSDDYGFTIESNDSIGSQGLYFRRHIGPGLSFSDMFINSTGNVGIGTKSPDQSAALDVTSNTQGFLPPRMTVEQRDALVNPAAGLMIYCSNCGSNGQWQGFNGNSWQILGGSPSISCPTGYILVPGNSILGTEDFCVMKYEAKNSGGTAISVPGGTPWVNITQNDARNQCLNVGADLMTLAQRQTINRNVEGIASNWSSGIVGSGSLNRGHSDNSPANSLAAGNDNDPCFGTGDPCSDVIWHIQRRTHLLSNGEVIWDLSGNVYDLLDDVIQEQDKPNNGSSGFLWQEWAVFQNGEYGTLSYDLLRPTDSAWTSTEGIGQYYAGNVSGTNHYLFLSGQTWNGGTNAGLFSTILNQTLSYTSNSVGFRCTKTPQ